MERCFIVGEGMPDAECEHAILDRIHHGFEHNPARDSERGMSRGIAGERIREYAGGERGSSQSIWSHYRDPVMLLNVSSADWRDGGGANYFESIADQWSSRDAGDDHGDELRILGDSDVQWDDGHDE